MKGWRIDRTGLYARLKLVLSHITGGFSFVIAPHGTGTAITFNLSGKVSTVIVLLVIVLVVGLAFIGVTYTKLAVLGLETSRLRTENEVLRAENRKIVEIEKEVARLDEARRAIETWAGVVPEQVGAAEPESDMPLARNVWPRRYSYAIMKPFYLAENLYAQGMHPYGMVRPVTGWISRGFIVGEDERPKHPGIDIAAAKGTPVRSALDGVVWAARWDDVYGNLIVVEHNDSVSTIYGHNEKIWVKEGDHVTKGQVIASVGNTGRSTAPHLHFEILIHDNPVDPALYVDFTTD